MCLLSFPQKKMKRGADTDVRYERDTNWYLEMETEERGATQGGCFGDVQWSVIRQKRAPEKRSL